MLYRPHGFLNVDNYNLTRLWVSVTHSYLSSPFSTFYAFQVLPSEACLQSYCVLPFYRMSKPCKHMENVCGDFTLVDLCACVCVWRVCMFVSVISICLRRVYGFAFVHVWCTIWSILEGKSWWKMSLQTVIVSVTRFRVPLYVWNSMEHVCCIVHGIVLSPVFLILKRTTQISGYGILIWSVDTWQKKVWWQIQEQDAL